MSFHFIDTHCHFDFAPFIDDAENTLYQAMQSGIERLIVPSVTADRFTQVSQLSQTYPMLFAALGLHPLYIQQHQPDDLRLLESLLNSADTRPIALGEIGLDNYMADPQPDKQLHLLRQQLILAKHYDLPVILHSRRSHEILLKTLRQAVLPRRGVIHGFAGSLVQAQNFIEAGYYLGVGGTITYSRAQKTRKTLATVPLTALLLETDAPDMPVAGFQGQANRPERLVDIFHSLCELRPESPQVIATQIYQNTLDLFKLR